MKRRLVIIIMFLSVLKLFGCKSKSDKSVNLPSDKEIEESIQSFIDRPVYKILTKENIDTTKDEKLEIAVFDNISIRMTGDDRSELEIIKTLSKGQQAIYSTWSVEGEVNNGGFNQFYFNSSGQFAEMAVDGFETVGAKKFAYLMREANRTYKSIKNQLNKSDDGTVESFSKSYENNPLNKLDDQFYDLYKTDNLNEKRIKYIRSHIAEFTQK